MFVLLYMSGNILLLKHRFENYKSFALLTLTRPIRLGVNKGLDVVQPPEVLALLLDVDVVGDEDGQGLVDATLLQEAVHEDLKVLVEAAEGGAGVELGTLLSELGVLDLGNLDVVVVEHVLNNDVAVLGAGIDAENTSSLAGLLNHDGQVDGSGSLLLLEVLVLVVLLGLGRAGATSGLDVALLVGVLDNIIIELLILEGTVLAVGVVVVDVGDGEADGDPVYLSATRYSS